MYWSCGFWDGESIIRSSQLFLNFCMKMGLPTISSPYDRLCWKPSWWDFHRPICLIILNSCNLTCHNCNWKNEKGSYNPALFGGNTPPQKTNSNKKKLENWCLKGDVHPFFLSFGALKGMGINSSLGNVDNLRALHNSAWNSMKTLR